MQASRDRAFTKLWHSGSGKANSEYSGFSSSGFLYGTLPAENSYVSTPIVYQSHERPYGSRRSLAQRTSGAM